MIRFLTEAYCLLYLSLAMIPTMQERVVLQQRLEKERAEKAARRAESLKDTGATSLERPPPAAIGRFFAKSS
jgi:hypothetical protein